MNKKLSIIMPTFQEEKSIKETIIYLHDFLDNQKINFEIIVVDDNSIDNTQKIVNKPKNIITLAPLFIMTISEDTLGISLGTKKYIIDAGII